MGPARRGPVPTPTHPNGCENQEGQARDGPDPRTATGTVATMQFRDVVAQLRGLALRVIESLNDGELGAYEPLDEHGNRLVVKLSSPRPLLTRWRGACGGRQAAAIRPFAH